ncbi:sensor histidine kinase [Pseudocnuella soli]|uniref:sensor histidine kinase n=1 Tax=Pseudocnuella soli TaxID=2502779 RepID=UPI001050B272|nr:sensor histidine kinase [Pseudocnuella soli]
MSRRPFYNNTHFLLIASGFVVNTLLAVVYRYINSGSPFVRFEEWSGFYGQGWPIMAQTFVVLYFVYYSIRYFNKKYSAAPNSFSRFLNEILFVLLVGFAIMQAFYWVFITYQVVPEEDMQFLDRKLKMILTIDVTLLIVIYAFMTSFRIFRYLQQKNLELLQWQKEYAQTQFETVKNKLNPHFLFNSLNALSSLVWVDADKAEIFIEKLSRSYRYLLEHKEKTLVPLADELQFLQSFLYLMQERFGNKLQVMLPTMDAGEKLLLPHSLMIVFDYLLAQNKMSAAAPLHVTVAQDATALLISYNPQPKEDSNTQAAEQLVRLQEQYNLQGKPMVLQQLGNGQATIQLPLF